MQDWISNSVSNAKNQQGCCQPLTHDAHLQHISYAIYTLEPTPFCHLTSVFQSAYTVVVSTFLLRDT